MSILTNILPADSYAERYYLQYQNLLGSQVQVKIYERDYVGESESYLGAGNDVDIIRSFTDGDFFKPISGTQIQLKIVTYEPNSFRDFRHADNRKYWVEVKLAGTIVAFGYILPETYEQDWGSKPHIVKVVAADQLGLLDSIPFRNNDGSQIIGIERLSDIITFLFYKAGMREENNWWDGVGLRPDIVENSNYGLFYNLHVDCSRWKDFNCRDVLIEIMESFNVQVTQYQHRWLIKNPVETRIYYGVKYDRSGAVVTTGITTDSEYQVTGIGFDGLYSSRLSMTVEPPVGKIELEYQRLLFQTLIKERYIRDVSGGIGEVRFYENSFSLRPIAEGNFDKSGVGLIFDKENMFGSEGRFKLNMEATAIPRTGTFEFQLKVQWTWLIINSGGGVSFESTRETWIQSGKNEIIEDSIYMRMLEPGEQLQVIIHPPFQTNPAKVWHLAISKYSVIAVDSADNEYLGDNVIELPINNENRVLKIKKSLGFEGVLESIINTRLPYIYQNTLMNVEGGLYKRSVFYQYMLTSARFTLVSWIKNTYLKHYGWNKLRVSADIKNMTKGKILWSFTEVLDPNIDQTFAVASSRWNPKLDYYTVELIGFTTRDWILATGFWHDGGVWIDTEFWIDEL